jgi:hypothetical protein
MQQKALTHLESCAHLQSKQDGMIGSTAHITVCHMIERSWHAALIATAMVALLALCGVVLLFVLRHRHRGEAQAKADRLVGESCEPSSHTEASRGASAGTTKTETRTNTVSTFSPSLDMRDSVTVSFGVLFVPAALATL